MNSPVSPPSYGTTRQRAPSVSYAEIEAAARGLMSSGRYASVGAVRKELKRGSTTTIAEAMQRFWKHQAALDAGNPVALTRLPPEFADAAVELWEQALRLSQQTAIAADNRARERLEELRGQADARIRSVELREKEWDMAARVRERALSDAREQVTLLLKELAESRAELRSLERQKSDLADQVEQFRTQLANVIAKAVVRHRPRRAIGIKTSGAISVRSRRKRQKASRSSAKKSSSQRVRQRFVRARAKKGKRPARQ